MRNAAIISAVFHVSAILMVYFGPPSLFHSAPILDQVVAVDVVMMDETPAPKPAAEPPPKPEAAAPPPPPPPEAPPVPEPPSLAAVPEPPPPPEPEPVPLPAAKPEATPKPKAEPKPAPEPKVQAATPPPRPTPPPPRKPPPPDQFQALLKNLAQEREKASRETEKKTEEKAAQLPPLPTVERPAQRSALDDARVAAGLAQRVRQQVTPCWSIPGGAKGAEGMQIAVRIMLNPDGTLRGPPRVEDTARMSSDPHYRAMAESALRALRNPRCAPLKLPTAQYDIWKEITFNFDPSEALGP